MTSADTLPVTVEVLRVETINRGALLALADVGISFDGVEIEIQGVQVRRGPDGRWLPAVVLPPELGQAVAEMVCHTLRES